MPLTYIRQDITKLKVDAIVNAANCDLLAGGGVCGAIFQAAGRRQLQAACDRIGHVDTGDAVITPGFALPARYVIHTAGPVWRGGTQGERELLFSCYVSSLRLAAQNGARSVAFPLISSGIYGYPPSAALAVATEAIRSYLQDDPDMEVTLCLFDKRATTLTERTYGEINQFVDDCYVDEAHHTFGRSRLNQLWPHVSPDKIDAMAYEAEAMDAGDTDDLFGGSTGYGYSSFADAAPAASPAAAHQPRESASQAPAAAAPMPSMAAPQQVGSAPTRPLDQMLKNLDAPFSLYLLSVIDERGMSDSQVYNKANLSRQYFSKLRSGKVNPSKRVVLSLSVALGLDISQTRLMLQRAGYALSHAEKFDIIVEWFIRNGCYDVFTINDALFRYDQPLLGAS